MCKPLVLCAAALTGLLTACATPNPPAESLSRAGAESRLLDAIGLVPAISVIFDAVAEKRMEDGRARPGDARRNTVLRAVIERSKPELAEAFAAPYSTAQVRAFVAFMESENGRPFGRMHARIVALTTIAAARGVEDARVDALSRDAIEMFWADAAPDVRAATECFLNSPDGEAWSNGLDAALTRLLGRYQVILAEFALTLHRYREQRRQERTSDDLHAAAPPPSPAAAAA